jgi:hypothetical protein
MNQKRVVLRLSVRARARVCVRERECVCVCMCVCVCVCWSRRTLSIMYSVMTTIKKKWCVWCSYLKNWCKLLPYWCLQNNWGPENGFQRFFQVQVYYWKTVEKQGTDPQLFCKLLPYALHHVTDSSLYECMQVCIFMCMYAYACMYLYVYVLLWKRARCSSSRSLTRLCMHVFMCMYSCGSVRYITVYIYIYIYICTYMCMYCAHYITWMIEGRGTVSTILDISLLL